MMKGEGFVRKIQEGRLLTPLIFISTAFVLFILSYKIEKEYENYIYKKKYIRVPLKNYVIFPQQKVLKKGKKKKVKEESDEREITLSELRNLYLQEVVSKIEANKRYPEFERRMEYEDTVRVILSINRDGSLRFVKILRKSRYSGFNKEALDCIYRSLPFPPFPEALKMEHITIVINLEFKLT